MRRKIVISPYKIKLTSEMIERNSMTTRETPEGLVVAERRRIVIETSDLPTKAAQPKNLAWFLRLVFGGQG